jgi:hypothetical protein
MEIIATALGISAAVVIVLILAAFEPEPAARSKPDRSPAALRAGPPDWLGALPDCMRKRCPLRLR